MLSLLSFSRQHTTHKVILPGMLSGAHTHTLGSNNHNKKCDKSFKNFLLLAAIPCAEKAEQREIPEGEIKYMCITFILI